MAVFSVQLAVYHTKPASRGTRRATAVKPRPTCFLSSAPAPYGRGVGCRGSPPAASHEARCRMAVFPVQLAVCRTRPASRGTCRATAVKPRPTCVLSSAPRPMGAVWGAGGHPLLRAMRPVAEWRSFLFNWRFTTPNPRGPLPSGGNSAANPHVSRVPRALRARCGVQGSPPAASHEARCRMAVFPVQLAVYHTRPARPVAERR